MTRAPDRPPMERHAAELVVITQYIVDAESLGEDGSEYGMDHSGYQRNKTSDETSTGIQKTFKHMIERVFCQ